MKNRSLIIITLILIVNYLFSQTWETSVVATAPISTRPVICSDPLGHLHIAWTSESYVGEDLNYATNQQGQWGYQRKIAGGSYNPAYVPVITANAQGFAYIAARFNVSGVKRVTNNEIISSNWTYNGTPYMFGGHFHEVSIEVDSDKDVHIFAQDDTWGSNVFYQTLALTDVVILGGTSAFYSTTIDQSDVLHFAGSHSDNIWYTYKSTGSWSSPVAIDQLEISTYHPSITCDINGVLHVVFVGEPGSDVIYYLNNESGTWGTPEITSGVGVFPHVVIDENGSAHVAYHTKPDPGYLYYMNNIGGSWSTPSNIATINTDLAGTEDAAHVGSKIALDLVNSTVNIVYIQSGNSVTVAQTDDYELRSAKSTDLTTTLVSTAGTPAINNLGTGATGELTLMEFTISDITGDGLPTKIQEMVFQRGSGTSDTKYFNDFFQSMTIEVSDASSYSCLVYSYKILAGTEGSVWKNIPEGGSLSFTLKGTLKDPLENIVEKSVQLKLNGLYDVIIDPTGSLFANTCDNILSDIYSFQLIDFGGSGTEGDPFLITDLDDLKLLSENDDYWSYHFKQTANIDASATSSWNSGSGFSPIGGSGTFSGSYDGDNNTINGLFINRPSDWRIGLFSQTSGLIENLGVTNVNITGGSDTGGLAGELDGTTSNCYTSGNVTGTYDVGGLTGFNNGTISNSYSTANVGGDNGQVGGFSGYISNTTVSNCYSTGTVTRNGGTSTEYAGFCGRNWNGTIENCYSSGSVIYSGENPTDKGFVGAEGGTTIYKNNFFDKTTSFQTADPQAVPAAATGKTTTEMNDVATFTDYTDGSDGLDSPVWDFVTNPYDDVANNDYWDLCSSINNNYPILSWQNGTTICLGSDCISGSLIYNTETKKFNFCEDGVWVEK